MTKEISKQDQESLVKTSAEGAVELSETELSQVAGGGKNKTPTTKTEPLEYLKIKLEDVLITSVPSS